MQTASGCLGSGRRGDLASASSRSRTLCCVYPVTVRFSITPIDDTPVLLIVWRSDQFWPCLAGVALAPPTGSSATVSDGSAAYANAQFPLTTMVPLMTPLVSPVSRFEHWSVVKLPLAPAYRPVPPIIVQGSTWRRSPLAHKPLLIPKNHAKMLSPLAGSPTIKRLPPGFPGGVFAKANSTGIE